jgi:ADP-heptose:LPS heptosyltransferase
LPQGSELHYLTKPSFNSLLNENPYLDKLWLLKSNLNETINEIKAQKFDYIIDLHNNLRSFIIKNRCGVPSSSFDKLNFKKFLITRIKINKLPAVHIVDRYFRAVNKLGIFNDNDYLSKGGKFKRFKFYFSGNRRAA